jgi:hypothetical protein
MRATVTVKLELKVAGPISEIDDDDILDTAWDAAEDQGHEVIKGEATVTKEDR